ncbi:hypothetical protein PCE1_000105 [Barthelona sp. PCE]
MQQQFSLSTVFSTEPQPILKLKADGTVYIDENNELTIYRLDPVSGSTIVTTGPISTFFYDPVPEQIEYLPIEDIDEDMLMDEIIKNDEMFENEMEHTSFEGYQKFLRENPEFSLPKGSSTIPHGSEVEDTSASLPVDVSPIKRVPGGITLISSSKKPVTSQGTDFVKSGPGEYSFEDW